MSPYLETRFGYDCSTPLEEHRARAEFDTTCQGTVPAAAIAFLAARDFEDAVRNAISFAGDTDTTACIAGAIARRTSAACPRRSASRSWSASMRTWESSSASFTRCLPRAEAEALGEELERFDLDAPEILIDGVRHRRVLRCPQTYFAASGPVVVERSLYSTRQDGERAVCPLELRAGVIEGLWTPLAAKQAAWAVAHLVPRESEEMFELLGGMKPSRSALDQLPKQLSERWEVCRATFEQLLRAEERVPPEAAIVAVSLDGVMVPMKDGERVEKRQRAAAAPPTIAVHTCPWHVRARDGTAAGPLVAAHAERHRFAVALARREAQDPLDADDDP